MSKSLILFMKRERIIAISERESKKGERVQSKYAKFKITRAPYSFRRITAHIIFDNTIFHDELSASIMIN